MFLVFACVTLFGLCTVSLSAPILDASSLVEARSPIGSHADIGVHAGVSTPQDFIPYSGAPPFNAIPQSLTPPPGGIFQREDVEDEFVSYADATPRPSPESSQVGPHLDRVLRVHRAFSTSFSPKSMAVTPFIAPAFNGGQLDSSFIIQDLRTIAQDEGYFGELSLEEFEQHHRRDLAGTCIGLDPPSCNHRPARVPNRRDVAFASVAEHGGAPELDPILEELRHGNSHFRSVE